MTNTPRSTPAFNSAGDCACDRHDTAALIVDVQFGCITHMDEQDAENYLTSLGNQIRDLRERGIPITWAVIDDHKNTKFHAPASDSGQLRSPDELNTMGFYAVAPDKNPDEIPNKAIFDRFLMGDSSLNIEGHGPRKNEAVFTKPAFNSFGTSERDRVDAKIPDDAMPRIHAEHAKLIQHLKTAGVENLAIFGAVGSQCCLESGIGAVQSGFKPSLILNGVVCWRCGEGQKSQLVWRDGFESPQDADLWHRSEILQAPRKPSRGFSQAEVAATKQIHHGTYQEFIAVHDNVPEAPALTRNQPDARLQM